MRNFRNVLYKTIYNVTSFYMILQNPYFDMSKGTIMFHYGADQNLATPQVLDIVNSYVNFRRDHNFIMIDYENINTVREGVRKETKNYKLKNVLKFRMSINLLRELLTILMDFLIAVIIQGE